MSDNKKLGLFSLGCAAFLIFALAVINRKLTLAENELYRSCQTGALIYVLKNREDLPLYEKRRRIFQMGEDCRKHAKEYLNTRVSI